MYCHQDLGIMVDEKLSWTKHYNHISLKAYRTLHLIRRSISPSAPVNIKKHLYIMLVRSQLTYCSQLWRPRLIKDIKCLERVQRRATKFVLQDYPSDYKTRLLSLKLLPLMYWFELQDILFLIRFFKDPSDNNILNYVSFVNLHTRSIARKKLRINFNKTSLSQHFYFNRVARLWNSLPPLDLSLSFNTLKFHIKQLFWNHFTAHFNPIIIYVRFTFFVHALIVSTATTQFHCNYNHLQQHLFMVSVCQHCTSRCHLLFFHARIFPCHFAGAVEFMNYEL